MAVALVIFETARSPKQHKNPRIDPRIDPRMDPRIDPKHRGYAQDFDSCTAFAVPRVAL